ncbi:MAG: hypothetical protein A2992_09050 [Elusimicrobia bacterium RIFCSPLOWO2_01_FULL_59_12]|nr:MAG: hypothetical protein A2992_09050 [Elusimicrobia bacterium RIFCSPLOWO2_01_FULL_59_12]
MNKTALRTLIVSQVFSLFFLIFMPVLVRLLNEAWGRVLYAFLALAAIGLALALRYALNGLE